MAGADRMTIEEVVKDVLVREHGDVLRAAVEAVCAELMEGEVSAQIGAERGERRPDDRMTHRNGYRPREWQTRAGTVELQMPKLRRGSYFASFLEPRRRCEQALLAVIQQAYACGVSTRRVDQLVESLVLRVSCSEVSRICQALDEHVEAFRKRPLGGAYAYERGLALRAHKRRARRSPAVPARRPGAQARPRRAHTGLGRVQRHDTA